MLQNCTFMIIATSLRGQRINVFIQEFYKYIFLLFIIQKFCLPLISALKTENHHDANFAIMWDITGCCNHNCSATIDDKVGIMTTLIFQWKHDLQCRKGIINIISLHILSFDNFIPQNVQLW